MKEFDLEAAKKGAAVCTVDGYPVRILCFDANIGAYPIVAILETNSGKRVVTYQKDGYPAESDWEGPLNLRMAPTERTGYVRIRYYEGIPKVIGEIETDPSIFGNIPEFDRIAKIEWEE